MGHTLWCLILLYCSTQEEAGHSSDVWQNFERRLSYCFTAFIKCNNKFYKGVSKITKDCNYSRKLCNVVNLKLKFNIVLQIFVFIC